jgi:hypothetical protein
MEIPLTPSIPNIEFLDQTPLSHQASMDTNFTPDPDAEMQKIFNEMGDVQNLLKNGGFEKKEKLMSSIDFDALWKNSPNTLKLIFHSFIPFPLKIFTTGVPNTVCIYLLGADPDLTNFVIQAKELIDGEWRDSSLFPPIDSNADELENKRNNRQIIITIYELWLRTNGDLYMSKGGDFAQLAEKVNNEYIGFINEPEKSLDYKFCYFGSNAKNQTLLYRLNKFAEDPVSTKFAVQNQDSFEQQLKQQRKRIYEILFKDKEMMIPVPKSLYQAPASPPVQKVQKKRGRKPFKLKQQMLLQSQAEAANSKAEINSEINSIDEKKDNSESQITTLDKTLVNIIAEENPEAIVKKKPGRKKGQKLIKNLDQNKKTVAKALPKKQKKSTDLVVSNPISSPISLPATSSNVPPTPLSENNSAKPEDNGKLEKVEPTPDLRNLTIGLSEEENITGGIIQLCMNIFNIPDPAKLYMALKSFKHVSDLLKNPDGDQQQQSQNQNFNVQPSTNLEVPK